MFAEDLSAFFDPADFAHAATLQGVATVNVIFDRAHLEALGISSTDPQCLAQASAVAAGDVGKTLVIDGVTYTIRDRQPIDDGAIVLLILQA